MEELSVAQTAILQKHFEEVTQKSFNWDNFVQEKGVYKSRTIQACWIGMKYGYQLGKLEGMQK